MEQITISISEIFGWSIGISTLVAVAVGALWSIGFNRIKEGQKAEFQKQIETQKAEFTKELETLKAKNDKCNYITKTQFDAEFKMYQELSSSTFEALMTLRIIDKEVYLGDLQKEYNEKWKTESLEKVNSFATIVHKYAPFIEENIFKKLSNLANK